MFIELSQYLNGLSFEEFLTIPLDYRYSIYNFKVANDLVELKQQYNDINPGDYKDSKIKGKLRSRKRKLKDTIVKLEQFFNG